MYIYTDDDLTRINRDYLGPKGKRLPWVLPYRVYAVIFLSAFIWFGIGWILQIPINQWTGLLFVFVVAMTVIYVTRRLRRDVSLWAMFKGGWQEVIAPRHPGEKTTPHQVVAHRIQMFPIGAAPTPRWWQFTARAAARPSTDRRSAAKRRSPTSRGRQNRGNYSHARTHTRT